jgi:hypothetical protein
MNEEFRKVATAAETRDACSGAESLPAAEENSNSPKARTSSKRLMPVVLMDCFWPPRAQSAAARGKDCGRTTWEMKMPPAAA